MLSKTGCSTRVTNDFNWQGYTKNDAATRVHWNSAVAGSLQQSVSPQLIAFSFTTSSYGNLVAGSTVTLTAATSPSAATYVDGSVGASNIDVDSAVPLLFTEVLDGASGTYTAVSGWDSTDKNYLGGRRDGVTIMQCRSLCDAEPTCKMMTHSATYCWLFASGAETLTVHLAGSTYYVKHSCANCDAAGAVASSALVVTLQDDGSVCRCSGDVRVVLDANLATNPASGAATTFSVSTSADATQLAAQAGFTTVTDTAPTWLWAAREVLPAGEARVIGAQIASKKECSNNAKIVSSTSDSVDACAALVTADGACGNVFERNIESGRCSCLGPGVTCTETVDSMVNRYQVRVSSTTNVYNGGYALIKSKAECGSADTQLGSGYTLQQCADACAAEAGCSFFVFGISGGVEGNCHWEPTSDASCSEGWVTTSQGQQYVPLKLSSVVRP